MPAPYMQQQVTEVPIQIVGGNQFGRYTKINDSQTWNMIISDGWLVPYSGYKNLQTLSPTQQGRGIHASNVGDFLIAVLGDQVYRLSKTLNPTFIGNTATASGDVYIAENNGKQIAITDGVYIYIYNYGTVDVDHPEFTSSEPGGKVLFKDTFPDSSPGYISFQNGRFLLALIGTQTWILSDFNNGLVWPNDAQHVGEYQIKPDFVQACVPMPGGGNNLFVFGKSAVQLFQDVGNALFPYQVQSTFNVDYGCVNASTIAFLNNYIVWIAVNEQSGPVLMVAYGNKAEAISTDGIDFKLGNLSNPENCTGFLYQQDGHLLYQFTFITDNISYVYDFSSKMFFSVSDENLNYHIAREIVYFNNTYFFVSLNGGNIYGFDTIYENAHYSDTDIKQLPRIRITAPLRLPSQRNFIARSLGFIVENGQPNQITTALSRPERTGDEIATEDGYSISTEDGYSLATEYDATPAVTYELASEVVDLSMSRDGGVTFGSSVRIPMNKTGKRKSRFIFQRLGIVNDVTFQIRFSGFGRFLASDGVVEIYQ